MRTTTFDFTHIPNIKTFYRAAEQQLPLPEHFEASLDTFWGFLNSKAELPLEIAFINMTLPQLEQFEDVIHLLEEAETALGEKQFIFNYYLKKDF